MDYKELAEDALKSAQTLKSISSKIDFYATTITDLLELDKKNDRIIQAAENAIKAYTKENADLTRKYAEAEERVKKAERERDAAVQDISEILGKNEKIRCSDYCTGSGKKCYKSGNQNNCVNFNWRGIKEK